MMKFLIKLINQGPVLFAKSIDHKERQKRYALLTVYSIAIVTILLGFTFFIPSTLEFSILLRWFQLLLTTIILLLGSLQFWILVHKPVKSKIELKPCCLKSLLEKTAKNLEKWFEHKNIKLKVHIAENLMIMSEPVSLVSIVFNNILSEVCKFSYPDSLLHATALHQEEYIVLQIENFGVNIAKDVQEQLFSSFQSQKTESAAEGKYFWNGILTAHKLMEQYGGSLSIKSKPLIALQPNCGVIIELRFQGLLH